MCPAKVDTGMKKKIEDICDRVCKALDVRDWCRIDLKCDKSGNPYVLEINSPAGLMPPEMSMTSYFPLAARTVGMDYKTLLYEILKTAAKRYGIKMK
jgi:D-alanine-D-alanine ligase